MRPNKEIGQRLQKLRSTTGLNQRQYALQHKFDPSVYARIEKGTTGLPEHYLSTILVTYKIDSHWLLTGEGSMFKDGGGANSDEKSPRKGKEPTATPVINTSEADVVYDSKDIRAKYYALLETNQEDRQKMQHSIDAAITAAEAAAKAANAATEVAKGVSETVNSLKSLQEKVAKNGDMLVALASLVTRTVAPLAGIDPTELANDLSNEAETAFLLRTGGIPPLERKKGTKRAKSQT